MDVGAERNVAVNGCVDRIRAIESDMGVSRGSLDAIKGELLALAAQRELFPLDDFPMDDDESGGVIYRLSEDADHRFALYASAARSIKSVPPHNHTTWAVIVGICGDEHNVFYERTDDGSEPGHGRLREIGRDTVRPGHGVALMPEDIHSIHVDGDEQSVHLHMYGLALEQLHERVAYDQDQGTYEGFPATQNIKPV
jgi:predicted metal-dependent enzyme (double-stranded beta helix superfamily)